RGIRAFKVVPQLQPTPAQGQDAGRKAAAVSPIAWFLAGTAVLGVLGLTVLAWHLHFRDLSSAETGHQFDPLAIPLVSDRVRQSFGDYAREPDFKAIAISREGWGISVGAADIEFAKREALDRCR